MTAPRNLAEFKRWLREPGATLTGLVHPLGDRIKPEYATAFFQPRTMFRVGTHFAELRMPDSVRTSRLEFGKASDWTFEGDTVTNREGGAAMSYRMSGGGV